MIAAAIAAFASAAATLFISNWTAIQLEPNPLIGTCLSHKSLAQARGNDLYVRTLLARAALARGYPALQQSSHLSWLPHFAAVTHLGFLFIGPNERLIMLDRLPRCDSTRPIRPVAPLEHFGHS